MMKSDGSGRIKPWLVTNWVLRNSINNNNEITLSIRNLMNKRPPKDDTWTEWPLFYRGQYNAIGREWFLEYQFKI